MPGIIGAASTPTGTPARASCSTACSRRAGAGARGSITRASAPSSVVTEIHTRTSLRLAMSRRMSRSRTTPADLVTMLSGWLNRSSTPSTARVSFSVRSTGWYGSVLEPSASGRATYPGFLSSFSSNSATSGLNSSLVSKSRPGE